jgi:hypothetical protein
MDSEHAKDLAEDAVAAVVEGAVSAIPIIGGPLAVAVNRGFGSAVQRRTDRIVQSLVTDIDRLVGILGLDLEQLESSEEMLAAFHRAVRAAQETSSDEKRRLLRNALLNGYVTTAPDYAVSDHFLGLMVKYRPAHVVVLNALREIMVGRTETLEHASMVIGQHLGEVTVVPSIAVCVKDLAADGLINEQVLNEVKEVNVGGRPVNGTMQTKQYADPSYRYWSNELGGQFLDVVADPFDELASNR